MPTRTEKKAAVAFVIAVAEFIREAGEIPEGTLYATLADRVNMVGFKALVGVITRAGLIERRSDMLRWVGPHSGRGQRD